MLINNHNTKKLKLTHKKAPILLKVSGLSSLNYLNDSLLQLFITALYYKNVQDKRVRARLDKRRIVFSILLAFHTQCEYKNNHRKQGENYDGNCFERETWTSSWHLNKEVVGFRLSL